MTNTVTAEEAFEARDAGEPVMISAYHAVKLVYSHDQDPNAFFDDRWEEEKISAVMPVGLADVLEWLGY